VSVMPRLFAGVQRRAVAVAVVLLALAPLAQADSIRGDCRYKGESIRFSDGVVFQEPGYFDKSRSDVVVTLATFAIDKTALAAAQDKSDAVSDQRFAADEGRTLMLRLAGGKVSALGYSGGGMSFSTSGSNVGKLQTRANDASHVDAGFTLDGDPDELQCALDFDLAYATKVAATAAGAAAGGGATGPAAKGKPLPPGGGDAGKVFQANLAAMRKGDFDAMLATVTQAQAEKMRAQKNAPDFAAMLEMMKAFAPKSANVTGGQDFGDRAELVIEALDQSGDKASGTSTLRKEGGQWKVDKTSMKSGL